METTQKKGLTGFVIKVIAIVTMFIDHCGAVFIERQMTRIMFANPTSYITDPTYQKLSLIDMVMRLIGRMAFPIFIFLLVQGFIYTRNRAKYAIRLGLFALISEVPFDMAFKNTYFTMSYQNVFFTLLMGFLFMCVADFIYKKKVAPILGYIGIVLGSASLGYHLAINTRKILIPLGFKPLEGPALYGTAAFFAVAIVVAEIIICRHKPFEELSKLALSVLVLSAFMWGADFLATDYGAGGVLAIAMAYAYRKKPLSSFVAATVVLTIMNFIEAFAFIDVLFIKKYNGEKGKSMKYFFYAFYPCHLLVIALVAKFLLGL
ncbi:MAG: hypothetical protein IKR39_06820 [Lachnospiraceae bacterium]|nr:hypothetical protein [Lachnospiraceae bacterium]